MACLLKIFSSASENVVNCFMVYRTGTARLVSKGPGRKCPVQLGRHTILLNKKKLLSCSLCIV